MRSLSVLVAALLALAPACSATVEGDDGGDAAKGGSEPTCDEPGELDVHNGCVEVESCDGDEPEPCTRSYECRLSSPTDLECFDWLDPECECE